MDNQLYSEDNVTDDDADYDYDVITVMIETGQR